MREENGGGWVGGHMEGTQLKAVHRKILVTLDLPEMYCRLKKSGKVHRNVPHAPKVCPAGILASPCFGCHVCRMQADQRGRGEVRKGESMNADVSHRLLSLRMPPLEGFSFNQTLFQS